jgi:tetratricopeptide (TPR) repeat protein
LSQTLVSILYRLGRLDRAAGVYSALEIKGWNNAFLLDQAADFRLATGDQAHALKLWKRVLQLKPQDSSTRELVAKLQAGRPRVDAFLNSEAELRTLAEKVSTEKEARYVGLLDKTRIQLFENRTWTTTRIIAVKALSQCGPDPFEIRFTYDSYIEDAAVLRAATLRPDGSVLPATDYGDHTLSAEEYNLYYELHSMGIRFEGVKPGDILVAAYEVQTAASSLGIPFSGLLWLQDSFAKYNTQVELIVPQEVELFHSIGPAISPPHFEQSLEEEEKTSRHLFRFPRLEAELEEPYPPGRLEIAAHFHFSQIEDWQGFASWYLELITGIGQADAAMRRKVETVVAESGDRQAVIRELCRYAADEIRYVGLELGVHGLKPYSPTEVVRRGFGDCKDKSLLLTTLLGLAGIPASVVILTTAPLGKGDLYPGSPAIFDHAIVHIAEGDFYFDPTARYMGLGLLPWQDQQAQAVVLAPSGPRKVQLPGSEAGQNVVEFSASVAGLEGGLAVSGTLHFTGQFAWRVLQALENRGAWENMVEAEVSSVLPVVELASVEEQVDDEALAVTVRFTGRWQPPDRSRVRILTDVNDTIQLISAASRQLPLVFGYPYRQVYDLQFGKGTFVPGRELTAQVGCDSASFRISSGLAGESTRVLVTFEQTRARIEQELYAEYRSLVNRFLEALAGLEGEVGRE